MTRTVAFCLWVLLGMALIAPVSATTRVYLATMAPGPLYFERFGHNAIVVHDSLAPASRNSVAFNFGYFDFESENFLSNFIQGKMQYLGVALNAESDIQHYISQGRSVWLQELNLDDVQQGRLIAHLREQTTPPNDVYRYDYFRANCSTRVRDALDLALDGALSKALQGRSHGHSFRGLGLAHAAQPFWLYLGIHLGLGPSTDEAIDIYQETFIPAALQQAVATLRIKQTDGAEVDLIKSNQRYGDAVENPMPPLPDWRWRFVVAGLAWAIIIAAGARFRKHHFPRRLGALVATLSALALGAGGLVLSFLWLCTDHQDAYRNLNLSLFSPFWLLCLPVLALSARGTPKAAGRLSLWAAHIALASACLGVALKVLPAVRQSNIEWVYLCLPIIFALHFAIRQRANSVH